jgi:hypothetical protein
MNILKMVVRICRASDGLYYYFISIAFSQTRSRDTRTIPGKQEILSLLSMNL